MALTDTAHHLIKTHFSGVDLKQRKLAVDATCGNGHDTVFLAELDFARVIGFDIQQQAIINTQMRLSVANIENVTLHNLGHEQLARVIDQPIDCIMFNFGYLPTTDKSICTETQTSIQALESTLRLLADEGIISLICYPGHASGYAETKAIQAWLAQLDEVWQVERYRSATPTDTTPILYIIKQKN